MQNTPSLDFTPMIYAYVSARFSAILDIALSIAPTWAWLLSLLVILGYLKLRSALR